MGYPWRRVWKPTPVFLPGEPHGQKRLVSYSPWDHKESDTTEWLTHTHTHTGAGYSLHNRLVFWKEGDLIINAGCSSGTVKVDKDSKGKREKNISYFTATLKNTSGGSQDGGGIGRRDHFLFYKFIERTTEQWTKFTKLLIASSGHQAHRKAAHCLRREVGQKY